MTWTQRKVSSRGLGSILTLIILGCVVESRQCVWLLGCTWNIWLVWPVCPVNVHFPLLQEKKWASANVDADVPQSLCRKVRPPLKWWLTDFSKKNTELFVDFQTPVGAEYPLENLHFCRLYLHTQHVKECRSPLLSSVYSCIDSVLLHLLPSQSQNINSPLHHCCIYRKKKGTTDPPWTRCEKERIEKRERYVNEVE